MKKILSFIVLLAISSTLSFGQNLSVKPSTIQSVNADKAQNFKQCLNNNVASNANTKVTLLNQGFEGTTFPPTGWTVQNGTTNPAYQWIFDQGHPKSGNNNTQINSSPTSGITQDEWLISPSVDLTTITNPCLKFWVAMSYYWSTSPNNNYDIRVKVSTNGGTNWTTIWTEDSAGVFADWTYTLRWVNLSNYATSTNFKVAFQYEGINGASLYLDDITIEEIPDNNITVDRLTLHNAYTQIPYGLGRLMYYDTDVTNYGANAQTNLKLHAVDLTTGINYTSDDTTLLTGESLTYVNNLPTTGEFFIWGTPYFFDPAPLDTGIYKVTSYISSDSIPYLAQDTFDIKVVCDTCIYSRDNNTYKGWKYNGLDASGLCKPYTAANKYLVSQDRMAYGVNFVAGNRTRVGAKVKAVLYQFHSGSGYGTPIAQSNNYFIKATDIPPHVAAVNPVSITLPFTSGYTMQADTTYLVGIQVYGGIDTVSIATDNTGIPQWEQELVYFDPNSYNWYVWAKGNIDDVLMIRTVFNQNYNWNSNGILPSNAGAISGLTTVCQGQNLVTYTVPTIANATSYIWTLPVGATGSSSTNSITVDYGSSAVSGDITVKGANVNGNGVASTLAVSVNPTPVVTNQTTSILTAGTFTVTPSGMPVGTTYTWAAPTYTNGVTGGSAQLTGVTSISQTLTIPTGTGTATYVVTPTSGSCSGNTFTVTVTVNYTCIPVAITTQPTATQTTCTPSNSVSFTVAASGTSPITYQWQYNNGSTWENVTNGTPAGATYINETSASMSVSGITDAAIHQYRCYLTNCSGASTATSNTASLTVNPTPAAAGTISGATAVYQGQNAVTYTVPVIANATTYIWTLPNGATGTNTTSSIMVNYGTSAISGNITVKGSNSCGDGTASSLYVTVNPLTPNCSAHFAMVADTIPHHYVVVNNASGIPPLHYYWSWGDGTHDTIAHPAHTYSTAGHYNICLTITDSTGCTNTYCDSSFLQKDTDAIISVQVIQGSTGINTSVLSNKIKIYPNPATNKLTIKLEQLTSLQNSTVSIYDIRGQLLLQQPIKQLQTEFNISSFAKAVYVIKINNDNNSMVSKFIKK